VIAPPVDNCDCSISPDQVFCPPADFCGRNAGSVNVINPPFPAIPPATANQNGVWWPQCCPASCCCCASGGGSGEADEDAESVCYVVKKTACKKNTQSHANTASSVFYPGYSPWRFITPNTPNCMGFIDDWSMESAEHGIIASLGANTSLDDFVAGCHL